MAVKLLQLLNSAKSDVDFLVDEIALIDDANVVERILTHLKVWDPVPDSITPAGTNPPWPRGETIVPPTGVSQSSIFLYP